MLIADVSDDMLELVNRAHRDLGVICRAQAVDFRRMAIRATAQDDKLGAAYAFGAAAAMEAVAKVFEAR